MKLKKTQTQIFLIAMAILLGACQPADVRPGFWLSGELVKPPPTDWLFIEDIEEIFIETNTWYLAPHSTTIWCVVFANRLYVGSYGDEKKTWENNVANDPEARLGVSGKLYQVLVTPVTDEELSKNIAVSYNNKYDMQEVFGDEIPGWWFYQVTLHP